MEGTLQETGTVPREAGTVVSHLQTGVKDLQKTSLPLPLDVTGSRKVWRSLYPQKHGFQKGQVTKGKQVPCSGDKLLFLRKD